MQHEHLYKIAIEQIADYAIFLVDLHGRVASWNAGVRHVLRWEESDWLGQPFSAIFRAEDVANSAPEAELANARQNGRVEDERWHVRKDGTQLWTNGITSVVQDQHGNVTGFVKVMRDLTEQKWAQVRQDTQLAVATVLAEATRLEEAIPAFLRSMCNASGWQWGALWRVDRAAEVLRLVDLWHEPSDRLSEFEHFSRRMAFARGVGLPGRVWTGGEPKWVIDVSRDENFPRRDVAERAGLHGALCFPVSWGGEVLAVMEFFSAEIRPPDEPLLGMMTVVGGQIGQFIDRRTTAEQLGASEARHAAGVEAALDCIVSIDHRGLVTEWNPAAERTFGYGRHEAIGQELAGLLIPPALREAHRQGLARYLATGRGTVVGRRFEITAVRKDGQEFPVELSITRLPSQDPPMFTGYLRDIGERKQIEAERERLLAQVRDQHRRTAEILESISDAFYAVDADFRFTYVNRKAEELLGRGREELIGRHYWTEFPQAAGTDSERTHRATMAERRPVRYEAVSPLNGRWVEVSLYPEAGGGLSCYFRDITERKHAEAALAQSEAQFRQLAETIPQLAWMAKPDGWIFWYNRRWYEYTGMTPERMEGWGWQDVHDSGELPRVMERWQHSLRTGEPFEMEFPLKGADGRFRWFLTRVAPLKDDDGNITVWFGTNTDIEDRRRIAEERAHLLEAERTARFEAERASRVKDEFLATLSHELRTPLNAILGWSQILAGGSGDEQDVSEGLRTIERNARAQAQIIEDLLDMSRIMSGKVRLDVQRVDMAALVRLALDTVKPSAEAKGIRIQAVLDPHAGPISGDPSRLQQVMWNLLSNAVKFTPKGGRVQVVLERVNSHVELSVIDTGEGIAAEFLPHVFDRFRQADATTTRRHGGLGLGLSIVKQLVELHGGTVRASSAGVGCGATFMVSLPLTVIHPEPEAKEPRHHPRVASPMSGKLNACVQVAGVKVLVVDDDPDARALIKRLLEECHAEVVTAGSAKDAAMLVQTERPHVLVSDIGMPGEDGYSLIRRVRMLPPDAGGRVPAIALTAYARAEDRVNAILAGFDMHVAKPVEPAELVAMVASLSARAT